MCMLHRYVPVMYQNYQYNNRNRNANPMAGQGACVQCSAEIEADIIKNQSAAKYFFCCMCLFMVVIMFLPMIIIFSLD